MIERLVDGPVLLTRGGLYVEPLNLQPADVVIEDVAHSLSNQCRFTGHTSDFYSVAEHSVRVTRWLESQGAELTILRWGLLHDASEAYLVDIPRPLKVDEYFGKAYRGAETRAQAAVCERFGLPKKMPELVALADRVLLATERRDLMPPNGRWLILEGIVPAVEIIHPWRPARAQERFLSAYSRLFEGGEHGQ